MLVASICWLVVLAGSQAPSGGNYLNVRDCGQVLPAADAASEFWQASKSVRAKQGDIPFIMTLEEKALEGGCRTTAGGKLTCGAE